MDAAARLARSELVLQQDARDHQWTNGNVSWAAGWVFHCQLSATKHHRHEYETHNGGRVHQVTTVRYPQVNKGL